MKTKALLLILLTLLVMSRSAFSQDAEEKLRVHIAPFNSFDPVTSVLQVGVQKSLNQRFALSLDHGFKMQAFQKLITDGESMRKNYRYSKTKAELKYFVRKDASFAFPYLALEGMYFPQKYVKENDFMFRDNAYFRYDRSDVNRTVWVTSLKYGFEVKANNFVFDQFFGFGVRRLSIAHEPVGMVGYDYYGETDVWFPALDRNEGIFYRPHMSMGLKVGYIIK